MANKTKTPRPIKTIADLEMIKSAENLLIEKEKRYQRKVKGPQVEIQTLRKETKKKALPKATGKKK